MGLRPLVFWSRYFADWAGLLRRAFLNKGIPLWTR